MVQNILSIDVEEVFHGEYTRSSRGNARYRSVENLPLVLDLLRDYDIYATFFVVGEIAERFPEVLKMIKAEGHEVSFHGWSHLPLWEQDAESFRLEVERFLKLHPDCLGYRAPSFSLDERSRWALRVLEDAGIQYDSSIFPVKTTLYGVPKAPLMPYRPSKDDLTEEDDSGIWEFPLLVYSFLGVRIPAAGGFYLRLMPSLVRKAIRARNVQGFPAIIYVHNWELDPLTPILGLNPYRSFITYHNIEKTREFFKRLLHSFQFLSFAKYMKVAGMI